MKQDIFPGISRSDYFQIDAMNISLLIEGERSMAHLKWALDHKKETTDAMERGTAMHLAVLEPAEFEKRVTYFPHPDCSAKVRNGKEWDKFQAGREEDLILKRSDFDSVIGMRDALRNHPRVREILESNGTGEMGVVWKDDETGIWCKGLVDRFCQCWGYTLVPDLKSCQDARPREFARTIGNLFYHVKAAWYLDGLNQVSPCDRRFIWIAIESSPPYGVGLFEPDHDTLNEGRLIYRDLLRKFKESDCTTKWPCYDTEVAEIRIPKYSFVRS